MSREEREFTVDERRWRGVVARRGPSGHALVYLLPLADGAVEDDDRRDRRAGLEPGRALSDLGDGELGALLAEGTPLTETESRFRAPDGRLWLAQSVGPVWSDEGVAEALTGLVFTSLEGRPERLRADGGHAGDLSRSGLSGRWRSADPGDGGDAAGSGEGGAES